MQTTAMLDDNFTGHQPLTIYSVQPFMPGGNTNFLMVSTPTSATNSGFRAISSASKVSSKAEGDLMSGKYHPSVIGQLKYKEYCKGLFEEHLYNQANGVTHSNYYSTTSGTGQPAYYRTASAAGQ
jgi:hypothetical protein